VNAKIEPLRAEKKFATTLEAEVVLSADSATAAHLRDYADELAGFLMVARATVTERDGASELGVEVTRTSYLKCERCWTYRPDVAASGEHTGLCARCVAALAATGRTAAE
jgi:isoleucyl-tRNA synthetase